MFRLLIASALLALCFFNTAFSQGLEISPVLIELAAQDRTEQIVLKNRSKRSISFDVGMRHWSQKDGEDVLVATDVFIVSPPALTMKPGDSRTIRLLRTEPADELQESSFRLILEEIPLKENKVQGRPVVALVLSIPLFAEAQKASAPDFRVSLVKSADGNKHVLTVNNQGKIHARILSAQPMAAGKALNEAVSLIGYALPGNTRSWEISAHQISGADALKLILPGGEVRTLPLPP